MLVALFAATRLPIGENPILLSAVPWLLGAVGTAWFTSPMEERERMPGQALMIAAVAVVILIAVPADPLTAGVAGAMALMPIAGARGRIPGRVRPAFSGVLLLTAAGSAVLAATGLVLGPISLGDLSIDVGGPGLPARAIALGLCSAATPARNRWGALPAGRAPVPAA